MPIMIEPRDARAHRQQHRQVELHLLIGKEGQDGEDALGQAVIGHDALLLEHGAGTGELGLGSRLAFFCRLASRAYDVAVAGDHLLVENELLLGLPLLLLGDGDGGTTCWRPASSRSPALPVHRIQQSSAARKRDRAISPAKASEKSFYQSSGSGEQLTDARGSG
jgi:hypothetical protein